MDIETLLSELTLDEKIAMLAGKDLWHTVAAPRLGIPPIKVTDGPNGARGAWGNMGPSSACIPVGIALGATWNPELIERLGSLLAEEVKAKGAHILLAPTVNIHRTPIAGRNFECFSEDPYLSGLLAAAYIKGIQNAGAGACIKHFVCNDQEFERNTISSQVEERPLREIYLEPFRLAIRAARPWSVMSSYNKINGEYASENDYLLKTILKEEWGFDGFVMSDWFGTYTSEAPGGGLDLEMPGPARWMKTDCVKQALESGDLTLDALDDKIRRILGIIERSGAFENPELAAEGSVNRPSQRALIREAARETIVLLTNRHALPLDSNKIKTIAVIGELAHWPNIMGGGSSQVTPHYIISPLDGIRRRAGSDVEVAYEVGGFIHKTMPAPDPNTLSTHNGMPGLELTIFDNIDFSGDPVHSEVTTRLKYEMFEDTIPNVDPKRFCLRLSGHFTPQESGLHTFELSGYGNSRFRLNGKDVLENWTGTILNTQKTVQLELNAGQPYALDVEFKWEGNPRWRAVRLGHLPPQAGDLLGRAVALAKRADVAIVVAGLTSEWESEGFDRIDMRLPKDQDELIAQVAKANPNTIVVLNAGSAVAMPWVDKVAAVVQQWYNSQECGNALADVLFGDANPCGKLPTTFPKRLEDNPAYINYPGEAGKVLYGEGLFVGYRYYDKIGLEPLFPFGHGLSYTHFEYRSLKLSADKLNAEEGLDVSFDLVNSGKVPGKEIVQLYVRDVNSTLVRPEQELKAFTKVELAPGQSKTVSFHLDKEAFWYYDPTVSGWQVEPGEFEILVGASSRDIRLSEKVNLVEWQAGEGRLHTGMTVRQLVANERGAAVLKKHFGEMLEAAETYGMLDQSLEQLALLAPDMLTSEKIAEINADLGEMPEE
jgi:beta-glucosidase